MAYHYIDNEKLTRAVTEHREAVLEARAPLIRAVRKTRSGGRRIWALAMLREHRDPPIGDFIAESFLAIANHLAQKPNFATSAYRDEMISEAVFDCTRNAHKFDSCKTRNAFGYFTRISIRAFFRVLRGEEKHSSRFVLGDLPEPGYFEAPTISERVSAAAVEHGTRSLLFAWVNEHGRNGYIRRGWPPLAHFEAATIEYLSHSAPR